MEQLAPLGPVYQAGTLSGNPLAMAAGVATLENLATPGFHESLSAKTAALLEGLQQKAQAAGIPFTTTQAGGMFGVFFTGQQTIDGFSAVMACDSRRYARFFHSMLEHGVYLAPSAFEAGFMSIAHGQAELDTTLAAAEEAFAGLS